METLTREQRRYALRPAREEYQYTSGDEWGFALTHWHGIADALYHADADIPTEWRYRHGACAGALATYHMECDPCPMASPNYPDDCQCTSPDREYVAYLDAGELGIEMLTYAGRVLDRYAARLERAGKDY